jgi:ADP-dependent NAD(P)H-hydrate dehydratase / NAD(P)H-hydrate epimerase
MKILSASQIKELDEYTIKHEPVDSIDLMERASMDFVNWFIEKFDKNKKVKIFCGPGNNGGDGLAIARILLGKSYKIETFIITSEKTSRDFKINHERLSNLADANYINDEKDIPKIAADEIVIDAIFGSGLARPVTELFAKVIRSINKSEAFVVSVDIASGLFCDQVNNDKNIIEPDYTISFQFPKISFLLSQNEKYIGEWVLVDIGLSKSFIKSVDADYFFTDKDQIKDILKRRTKFSHKGNFGKALIIAGSYSMMGAAVLAAKACLRTGAGLCVSYIPKCGYEIMQTSIPENMVLTDTDPNCITDIPDLNSYNAIAIGPGLGKAETTTSALKKLLERSSLPLVIDADALNILSENKELLDKIPEGSILTPHPKEFERLAGKAVDDYERLEFLKFFSKKIKSYIVLKGAYTAIASPDGKIYFNSTGNPGMATGGSGDVLTGIIVSLLAQGCSSFHSALLGVYLHGYSGDAAAKKLSQPSMIASDIVEGITEFYRNV